LQRVVFNADERRAEVSWYHITRTRYTLASNVRRDIAVLIEDRDPQRGAYFEMPTPADAREGHTRWPVTVPAGERAELVVQEREVRTHYENVTTWGAEYVAELREAGGLDDVVYERLQRLLTIAHERELATAQRSALDIELAQLLDLQEQLRKNLGALGDSEREVELRNRLLDDLVASEERRRAITTVRRELEQQEQDRETRQQAVLGELFSGA
jgi:hypothetical protein